MNTQHWLQVKEIFQSAVALPPGERDEFLAQACSGNDLLRQDVESLIAAHEKEGSFIDSPAYQVAAGLFLDDDEELRAGSVIGSYEIISMLGKGGMGKVYLAEDKRLKRKVALKFLPASFTTDADRLRRFEQEARSASALNHPNILTIHEIGEFENTRYIATEFIDGQTLRQLLTSEQISLGKVLDIGVQVCSALNAAHQAGIIHRDIKPDNIMLRLDGYVKVLDFGLAKLVETHPDGSDPEALTRRQFDTAPGVVLGTVNYMAPEQARGEEVNERADIWSLGVVLYEMVTGDPPFNGPTSSHAIVSILEDEPTWQHWPEGVMATELQWIVKKALRKDKEERHQTARELLGDLRSLKQRVDLTGEPRTVISSHAVGHPTQKTTNDGQPGSQSTTETTKPRTEAELTGRRQSASRRLIDAMQRHRRLVAFATLIVTIAAIIGLYTFVTRQRMVGTPQTSSDTRVLSSAKQITTWSGLDAHPSLSPDGNAVAYSSDRNGQFEIYVKQLIPGGREIQLTTDGGNNFEPAWSPDGNLIAYASKGRGGVWVMPALGGTARQLTEFGSYPAWSPDGSQLAFQSAGVGDDIGSIASGALLPSTIWIISAQGGNERQITKVGDPACGHGSPSWSPNGKRLAFGCYDPRTTDVWSVSVQGNDLKKITRGFDPILSPDGKYIYFASFGAKLNFGVSRIQVSESGEPVGEPEEIARTGSSRVKRLTMTANGNALAYGVVTINSNIWSLPVSTVTNDATGPPMALTRDTSHRNSSPSVSRDGQRIAYHVSRIGTRPDVWMMDADGANPTQLTTDPESDMGQSWFPNGKQVVFLSARGGKDRLWSIDITSGREKLLLDISQDMTFPQLSPDGRFILFNSNRSGTTNLWTVSSDGGEPKQLTFDKETMGFGCWSPDARFIAFQIKRGDDSHIGLIPASGGEPDQLTFDSGQSWARSFSPDGDKIAFAGFRDGSWNVWWVSRSSRNQKKLTNYSKLNAFVRYPAWSPLGDQIVYEYAETTGNIWMVELN